MEEEEELGILNADRPNYLCVPLQKTSSCTFAISLYSCQLLTIHEHKIINIAL